jgi:Ulp1 family protease
LVNAAHKSKNKEQIESLYMKQAVYVYEMADMTLKLLDELSLEGKPIIDSLHEDAKNRVKNRTEEINKQVTEAKSLLEKNLLTEDKYKKEEDSLLLMKKANEQSLHAWDELMQRVGSQENFINNLKNKRDLVKYKRDKALLQIETLRDIKVVSEGMNIIGNLDDLVSIIADLDLLVLDEQTVRTLLGYDMDR